MYERLPPADGLLVIDPLAGAVLYVNEAATALFDITEDRPSTPEQLMPELGDLTPREFVTRLLRRGGGSSIDISKVQE